MLIWNNKIGPRQGRRKAQGERRNLKLQAPKNKQNRRNQTSKSLKICKDKKANLTLFAGLTVVAFLIILFFGLRPKDFNRFNRIEWLIDRAGIQIGKYAIAYATVSGTSIREPNEDSPVFSIEMAFKPKSFQDKGFNLVFSLHDGKESDQLIVGQWQSSIIIMNGDDYDHKQRTPRAVIRSISPDPEEIFLTIIAGKDDTAVYANGMRVKTRNGFTLKYPEREKIWLTLGNSIYGRHPWNGEIYGFALYRSDLTEQQIKQHLTSWYETKDFSFAKNESPSMLYLFNEKDGTKVIDYGKQKHDLNIPNHMKALKRQMLSLPWKDFKMNGGFISDSAINLVGFIPLGFVLCALMTTHGSVTDRQSIIVTVVACFILSLMIEIVQSWIPSRSSSMLDLMLNSGGGFLGATIADAWRRDGL